MSVIQTSGRGSTLAVEKALEELQSENAYLLRILKKSVENLRSQVPANLTGLGSLAVSAEEIANLIGVDVQAHYFIKETRTISSPSNETAYWLPETGSLNLSNFSSFAFFVKKATNTLASIELHISFDNSTFTKADAFPMDSFHLNEWNTWIFTIPVLYCKLRVLTGVTGAGALEIVNIAKA
jgi:hypothetical protein